MNATEYKAALLARLDGKFEGWTIRGNTEFKAQESRDHAIVLTPIKVIHGSDLSTRDWTLPVFQTVALAFQQYTIGDADSYEEAESALLEVGASVLAQLRPAPGLPSLKTYEYEVNPVEESDYLMLVMTWQAVKG